MTEPDADDGGRRDGPPPASEDIHLPPPTPLPIIVGAATTVALVGVVVSPIALVIGLVVLVVAVVLWIRDVRREIAELPLEQG